MLRFSHILLWIQLDTNLFELGMQNSQLTLNLARTLRYSVPARLRNRGGGSASPSVCHKAKEKYRGVFEIQRSGDKTSPGEIGLDIRTHASPKVG